MLRNRQAALRQWDNEWQFHNWSSTAIRFLLALAAPASLVALVLAGIALRREGTTSFSVGGGGFSKWMFWAIVMITLPQVFGWFAFGASERRFPAVELEMVGCQGSRMMPSIFVNDFVSAVWSRFSPRGWCCGQ